MMVAHHSVLAQRQPALGQMNIDAFEQLGRQIVLFQQATNLQQRRGVCHLRARKIDADKLPHGLAVVDRILHSLVGQTEPLLREIHPQHARHADRLGADARL